MRPVVGVAGKPFIGLGPPNTLHGARAYVGNNADCIDEWRDERLQLDGSEQAGPCGQAVRLKISFLSQRISPATHFYAGIVLLIKRHKFAEIIALTAVKTHNYLPSPSPSPSDAYSIPCKNIKIGQILEFGFYFKNSSFKNEWHSVLKRLIFIFQIKSIG